MLTDLRATDRDLPRFDLDLTDPEAMFEAAHRWPGSATLVALAATPRTPPAMPAAAMELDWSDADDTLRAVVSYRSSPRRLPECPEAPASVPMVPWWRAVVAGL